MASEKFRHRNRNRDPEPPFDFRELEVILPSLSSERLSKLLWVRAQYDDVLNKTLMITVALEKADGDLEKAKKAIDYALHFPEWVRYTEDGHDQVIEEIKIALEQLSNQGQKEFADSIARYAIDCGERIMENFEDDWSWSYSLNQLKEWLQSNGESNQIIG